MTKYIKQITKIAARKEECDVSIRIVGSYDSLDECLSKRAQPKWKRGDVVELINDPGRGAGIITGKIVERMGGKRIYYQVQFYWSDESIKHREEYFKSEPWQIYIMPAATHIPQEQLKDSTQEVHPKLVELFSKASRVLNISKRAVEELSLYSDPQNQVEHLKKVLRHIEDNLKSVKDPNHIKWLQRKRYETMTELRELSGQKPIYEWIDYDKEIIKLQDELNKAKERLLKWERKELSPAELEELGAQLQEDLMPVRHVLESDVYALEEQIKEYQRSPEEAESYERYLKKQEDESAKYEAMPPNPHPDEAAWTDQGTLHYYEQPEEPAKPQLRLQQEPLKLSSHSTQDFAKRAVENAPFMSSISGLVDPDKILRDKFKNPDSVSKKLFW